MTALASTFTGQLLRPGDAGYDEARKVHNGLIESGRRSSHAAAVWPTSPMP